MFSLRFIIIKPLGICSIGMSESTLDTDAILKRMVTVPQEETSIIIPIVLITGLVLLISLFFYKRAIHEFRINQVDGIEKGFVQLHERIPCVVSDCVSPTGLWTIDVIRSRHSLANYMIDNMWSLSSFLTTRTNIPEIPDDDAAALAQNTGVSLWANHTITPAFKSSVLFGGFYRAYTYSHAGPRGLHKTTAAASLLIPTDGTLLVSIMHEQAEPYLPPDWHGRQLSSFTLDDTPLLGHIDYMDIILRPGNALLLPAHWTYCIISHEEKIPPLYLLMEFHHPVSAFVNRVLSVRGMK
jgi:hypothetical protein